jgi:predicted N-acetyltransferase YhbS
VSRRVDFLGQAVEVFEYSQSKLNLQQATRIVKLTNSIWPKPEKTESQLVQNLLRQAQLSDTPMASRCSQFVIWEGDRVVAHAQVFVRKIFTAPAEIDVLALAGVCTDPTVRGQGMGAAVVLRGFEKLTELDLSVCLFQTGVVPFYEKLGARTVENRFVNRQHASDPATNPWWDKAVMIYPADADWPGGEIDLGGAGY